MDILTGIAVEIPPNVQRGEAARLFPVLSENSKEGRATSVLLATLSVVDTLADALFRRLGRPIGPRTKINCFTEVVLKSDPRFRPDGLIVIDTGRGSWSALVECKIGKAKVEPDQVENYIKRARENAIDCVITVSNELVADPSRSPASVDGRLTKSVGLFHYSWLAIRSEAEIAYSQALVTDPEKNFILAELIRFLSHPSAGVEGFGQMPAAWPDLVGEAMSGRALSRNDVRIHEIADAWLQEEKELSLILSRLVSRRCVSRSERKLKREGYDPHAEVIAEICEERALATEFSVPDTAAEIQVRADLRSRASSIHMRLRAPEDRKRPEARLNWLLNQLKDSDPSNLEVVAHWPGRAKSTYSSLQSLRENPSLIIDQNAGLSPHSFDVVLRCHTPGSFTARKRFLTDLEEALQVFYSTVGGQLTAWAPRPPPPAPKTVAAQIQEDSEIDLSRMSEVQESLAAVLKSLSSESADKKDQDAAPFDGDAPSERDPA